MAATPFDRLMDDLRVRLPGALDSALQAEIFRVMDDFFKISSCWTEDIDMPVVPGTVCYPIAPSDNALIHRLVGVVTPQLTPVRALMPTPGVVDLLNDPSEAATYVAKVVLNVKDPTTRQGFPFFPQWVLEKHDSDILDGVLSRMMSQPAKVYSNTALAVFHERRFRAAVGLARVEALHSNTYKVQPWSFPRGGFITSRTRR